MIPEEVESGLIAGSIGILLLGAIIAVLGSSVNGVTKGGWIVYDIGVAGISWVFLDKAFDEKTSENLRVALVIAAAIIIAFGFRILAGF
ncbi:hypothetical protein A3L09_03845 [Thermococcus profundus]|uniref:Uncharacterized protein n=1 Tax=Thermococcus profundus TaxID=49899 RepID=A0A2Z2M9M6_THEPR|nr:hypothetical protein [Thermococcus profundus]ASJ02446.1 hypothetical protein A3L09_03845 [Thermococcus profundus]